MIFLIEYDKKEGKLLDIQQFSTADRPYAQRARLNRELYLNEHGVTREVLLLEAEDQKALERTHRRYFKTAAELIECDITEQRVG